MLLLAREGRTTLPYTGERIEGNDEGGGVLGMFDGFGSRLTMALGRGKGR